MYYIDWILEVLKESIAEAEEKSESETDS